MQNPVITLEANKFGTLDFTIFPGNPEYGSIEKLTSLINVYKDGQLYRQFRPAYKKQLFKGGLQYKCKEILSRLNDFRYRPPTFTGTVDGFVTAVLASYNARVGTGEQILKGTIANGSQSVKYETDSPLGHWDALQSINDDGYIFARYENGNVYLDYLLESDLPVADQKISFGENLTDLFIESDSESTFSVLYPIGKNGQDTITIASVNGGIDYLESPAAISLYGRRETTITWENVETASQLKTLAQAALNEIAVRFSETVQLTAVDLHNADSSIASFDFLHRVDCVSAPHGLSHRYVLGYVKIPLGSPDSSTLQLGETAKTLNDRITLERKQTQSEINSSASATRAYSSAYTDAAVNAEAQRANQALETEITTVNGLISAEVTRAQEAEDGKIAKDGNYTTVQSLLNDAQAKADSAAQSAKDASIAKTAQYQTADAIVSAAVAIADSDAESAYIAKTTQYQTADAVITEAVRVAGVNAQSAYLAKDGSYTTVNAILAEAQNKADAAAVTAKNASIAKTAQYQTADAIVSAAVAQAATDAGNTYVTQTTFSQTADEILQEAKSYTDNNAYAKVSSILLNSNGISLTGAGNISLNSGYITIGSGFRAGAGRTQLLALDLYSSYGREYVDVTDTITNLEWYGWIRNASVNSAGDTLTLTKGSGSTVTFSPGSAGLSILSGESNSGTVESVTFANGVFTFFLTGNYSVKVG